MAEFAKLIRNAIKEYDSKTLFCIYSAYQSEKNKRVYARMVWIRCSPSGPAKRRKILLEKMFHTCLW